MPRQTLHSWPILALLLLGLPISYAGRAQGACKVKIEVRNCSGVAVEEVSVEIEASGKKLAATTDVDGNVTFEVCAKDVDEVLIYLIEGGAPASTSPDFESDPESPHDATAKVVVC